MRSRNLDRGAIARGEKILFALASATPDGTDRMDDVLGRQPIPFGDLGITGLAAMERAAFGEQFRSGRTVDRSGA